MKKTTLFTVLTILFVSASCSSTLKKSLCECFELAANGPQTERAPAGCEWIEELSQKEQEELGMKAMIECSGLFDDVKDSLAPKE
tara:strand:+ start:93014 stop:93268 length:255 start_codon:yes stop_codon:yes gene_type:complete